MKQSFKTLNLCIVTLLVSLGQIAWSATELIQWQPAQNYPKIILPKLENETPEAAVERYLLKVQADSKLQSLLRGSGIEDFNILNSKIELLPNKVASAGVTIETNKLRVALIANQSADLTDGARVSRLTKTVVRAGGEPVVIALSADIGLSKSQATEFRTLVANRFDVLIGMGGEDVDPRLYGEENRHSLNVNRRRDVSELRLIKAFKKAERGVYFGICRGHQLGAVADGHTLYQDISKDGLGNTEEHIGRNAGYSHNNQTWHHVNVDDSLFLRFLENQSNPLINSAHHQAVRVNSAGSSVPVAMADNVVEALEAKNKLSFSVQFHPEFGADVSGNAEFSNMGFKLIRNIFAYSRMKRAELISTSAPRCRNIFRRM